MLAATLGGVKRIGVAVLCLLMAGCGVLGEAEAGPTDDPSSRDSTEAATTGSLPTDTPSARPEPAPVRWAKALERLRQGGPRAYSAVLGDSGALVMQARGRLHPSHRAASFDLLISRALRPGERFGGPVVAVGDSRYLRRGDGCWERIEATEFNRRLGLSDGLVGLTGLRVLTGANLLGRSLGSADVLRLSFPLAEVLTLFGAPVRKSRLPGSVEGEVTILDGEVTDWRIVGEALAAELPPRFPAKARGVIEDLTYVVGYSSERVEAIRRPPADKLAPSPGTACRDGEDREV